MIDLAQTVEQYQNDHNLPVLKARLEQALEAGVTPELADALQEAYEGLLRPEAVDIHSLRLLGCLVGALLECQRLVEDEIGE